MANFIDDDIDFSAYADMTECRQKLFRAGEYADEVVSHFWDEKADTDVVLPWRKTHGKIGIRPGELSLWAGINGHGKSLLLSQATAGFIPQRQRICVASLEMKPRATLARMYQQIHAGSRPPEEFIREYSKAANDWLWFYDHQGSTKAETMVGLVRYAATQIGCNQFILDSLMKCGMGEDDYNAQKRFVDSLCAVAQDTGIHVHLVVHSRKGSDESRAPGKMDVKGSGAITDLADNVFTFWRNKPKEEMRRTARDKVDETEPDGVLSCEKQRHGSGWEGRVGLFFEHASMQYTEQVGHAICLMEHPRTAGVMAKEDDF